VRDSPTPTEQAETRERIRLNIKQERELRYFSVARLARFTGLSQWTISRWEKGTRKPKLPHLVTLARAFGIPVSRFWTHDPINNKGVLQDGRNEVHEADE